MGCRIVPVSLALAAALVACGDKENGTTGSSTSTSETSTTDGTTGGGDGTTSETGTEETGEPLDDTPDPIHATVRGTVEVEVIRDVDGVPTPMDVTELDALGYPYGAIYVAGTRSEDGDTAYRGSTTVSSPVWGPNTFELPVTLSEDGQLYVHATLDKNKNAIVDSSDPMGIWPVAIEITDGAEVSDVVLKVTIDYNAFDWDTGGSGGTGGGGCTQTISGPVTVHRDYEGAGIAMVLDANGNGPLYWSWFSTTSDGTDAAATYSIGVCPDLGTVQLVGAIDSNQNGLIDPMDTSGAYVTSPDTNGNPIVVASADLSDYELQIPIRREDGTEEDNAIALVPFVHITGDITYQTGTFDDLDPGTRIHVAALKYRPNTSVTLASVTSSAYDMHTWEWADITGQTTLSYSILVPGNAEAYLWAYADPDLDGTLNEVGEPVASANNSSTGYIVTGTENQVHDMLMGVP